MGEYPNKEWDSERRVWTMQWSVCIGEYLYEYPYIIFIMIYYVIHFSRALLMFWTAMLH